MKEGEIMRLAITLAFIIWLVSSLIIGGAFYLFWNVALINWFGADANPITYLQATAVAVLVNILAGLFHRGTTVVSEDSVYRRYR